MGEEVAEEVALRAVPLTLILRLDSLAEARAPVEVKVRARAKVDGVDSGTSLLHPPPPPRPKAFATCT